MLVPSPQERARKAVFLQRSFMYSFSVSAVGVTVGLVAEYLGGRSLIKEGLYVLTIAGFVSLARQSRREARRIAEEAEAEAEERERL